MAEFNLIKAKLTKVLSVKRPDGTIMAGIEVHTDGALPLLIVLSVEDLAGLEHDIHEHLEADPELARQTSRTKQ